MESTTIYTIPASFEERCRLRTIIHDYTGKVAITPPISIEELSELSEKLIKKHRLDHGIKGWMMVEINNSLWRETVSSIPHHKRMLLLPKCLSNSIQCKATVDEFGLLCRRCNHCTIPHLQERADNLGMMSIVAEGFTSVIGLIESGAIDTVIGIGCLDSLEKAFPLLVDNAVPGIAIPLNCSGCKDTDVDNDYLIDTMSLHSNKEIELLNYEHLKSTVNEWFRPDCLTGISNSSADSTSVIAHQWMTSEGKRWRPYLLAAVFAATRNTTDIPEKVRFAAIAVECFHKASLVHDDIQDNDTFRYGKQTIHSAHGIPIAINVGDLLLGEGYRLMAMCDDIELIKTAAAAHIALCKGQGMELEWSQAPDELTLEFVLEIICNKTVPAFDVALDIGAICAGADSRLRNTLHAYSRALGIAYQLKDDIEDFETDAPVSLHPSAVLAVLCEQNREKTFIRQLRTQENIKTVLTNNKNIPLVEKAVEHVREMSEEYRRQAIRMLQDIKSVELKRLLFRITKKIMEY